MQKPTPPPRSASGSFARLALAGSIAALVAAGWLWARANGIDVAALSPGDVRDLVDAWGSWGPLGAIVLMVLHSFVPLPAEIIAIANGLLFGTAMGVAYTWVGAMLGAILSYALARWLGLDWTRRLVDARRLDAIAAAFGAPSTLLLIRLVPVISFNLVNYGAGLFGVAWWPFLWTTALGILPLTVVFVALGERAMFAPWWIWAIVAASCLALTLLLRVVRRRMAAVSAERS